jgi:hypothetical protein
MTKAEYDKVDTEFQIIRQKQSKFEYRTKKFFSENAFFKWICCCLKVKDELNLEWHEMSPVQK